MAEISTGAAAPGEDELERMHALYRRGGQERQMAPHIVYQDALCPHADCGQQMQAIDFRLENHGRAIHDPLVAPGGMIRDSPVAALIVAAGSTSPSVPSSAVTAEEAAQYPQLPDNWHLKATIL